MTDAQTEARAIVSAILVDERLAVGYQIETLADAIVEHIATALAAKDAELAILRAELNDCADEIHALRAQLAEANKALDALGAFAFWFRNYPEFKPNPDMQAEMLANLDRARPFIPARRARETQGGHNG